MPMKRRVSSTLAALIAALSVACGSASQKNDDSSQMVTAPDPATSQLNASWTGTITRPNGAGLSPIAIQWAAKQDSTGRLTGPFAMTLNGVTLTASFSGVFTSASTPTSGVVSFFLSMAKGDSTSAPSCSIFMNAPGILSGFTQSGPQQVTSTAFAVNYSGCSAFLGGTSTGPTVESGYLLSLSKQ